MMLFRDSLASWPVMESGSAVIIGVLDGVHIGHQALLRQLGDAYTKTVLTFDPHPMEVLRPGSHPRLITDLEERIELLASNGVERVGVLDLTEVREYPPEEFVESVLIDRLRIGRLVVGADFRFGRDRAGDVKLLRSLGASHGFEVETIALVDDGAEIVSSSRIRHMIEDGEVGPAAGLLGSRYRMTGKVIQGDKRGREIGFPTANMHPPIRKVIPAIGIYAAFVRIGRTTHQAAINVGVRPTFGGGELLVEAYVLDFDADLYGSQITVEFVEYLRPEKKFDGVEPLVEAMTADVVEARRFLDAKTSNMS